MNSANWTKWSADPNALYAGQGYHGGDDPTFMFHDQYPTWAKHDGGARGLGKHPSEDRNLTGSQAEMYVHPPKNVAHGVVVRFTVPTTGNYILHDTWARPIQSNGNAVGYAVFTGPANGGSSQLLVDREEYTGIDVYDYNAFTDNLATFYEARPYLGRDGLDIGLLTEGSFIYFVVDNHGNWAHGYTVIRFRLK